MGLDLTKDVTDRTYGGNLSGLHSFEVMRGNVMRLVVVSSQLGTMP